tara:strand:- start:13474 stop:14319 length:846 start_codon:yes stop_codon:yes gene_type:complete
MAILTPKQQNLVKTRADFLDDEFRRFHAQKGLEVLWEQTAKCPSQVDTTEYGLDLRMTDDFDDFADEGGLSASHPSDCPVCGGSGIIRHSQQLIKAIVTNSNGEEKTDIKGTDRYDEVKFSLLPEHLPSFGDRFILVNSQIVQNEILVRGNTTSQVAGLDKTTHSLSLRSLKLEPDTITRGTLYLHKTDANGLAVVGGALEEGVDYEVVDNGGVKYIDFALGDAAGTAPLAGQHYSLVYYANPQYVVSSHPHSIRDTVLRLKNVETPTPMIIQAYARLEML